MTNANDFAFNDTATRLKETGDNGIKAYNPPLTKREYFAAMAMQGLLSDPNNHSLPLDKIAKDSASMSDELIKALNDTP